MAVDIRPTYQKKLRYALKLACFFWFLMPAGLVSAWLSISTYRWVGFEVFEVGGSIVVGICAVFWAAHVAELPRPATTWREICLGSAIVSALLIAVTALPYFRYTYVHVGPAIVRVDRLTGTQCRFPPIGCESAPYDPIMSYDAKTGSWAAAPSGRTVRDWVSRQ